MISKLVYTILLTGGIGCLLSCHKKEFLDQKPSSDLFIPGTLIDLQALLDNDVIMSETPVLGELSSDNFYVDYTFWQTLTPKERNAYTWAPDIYAGIGAVGDWNFPYQQVFYANVVLDGINKVAITGSNAQTWNAIKGSALFIRAYAFYNVTQVFAPVYDKNTADNDLGIPLRLNPNVDEPSHRSTVNQTYTQILSDLLQAKDLLQDSVPVANLNRPSKPAAFAMLARVYLSMQQYDKAGAYADSCLQLHGDLIDYNTLTASSRLPFNKSNQEALYQSKLLSSTDVLKGIVYQGCIVDSNLYQSYDTNDLRRSIFYIHPPSTYPTVINPKGSYNGTIFLFSGLATDEALLTRAECAVRTGNVNGGIADLNKLLRKRWKTGTYNDTTITTVSDALNLILTERRKELPFRGLRWTDLRRLNKEGANITLNRTLNGQPYQLKPNSPLYVLPIPPDVIQLSNIPQNNRQ